MNILRDYRLVPIEEGEDYVKLMVPKGVDPFLLEEVRFRLNKDLLPVFVEEEVFAQELQRRLSEEELFIEELQEGEEERVDILMEEEKSPAVSLVNTAIIRASFLSVSDIHIEPYEDEGKVRFRLDGVLHDFAKIPKALYEQVVSRIKVLAGLNVAERRIAQDGRIRVKVGGKEIDIRVSVVPTLFGERVVLRLLDKSNKLLTLEDLGLSPKDMDKIKKIISKPYGMVLATGPTGSGKSTTLYAILLTLMSPYKNIITIEDPPEYQVKGVAQIQVNPKVGLTFASGLRAILRQDPDIVMVGEIRDEETAHIAVHAALTGHLLLSTLHTNDAPSAITRLSELGIEPFLIASALEGVIAQRLVRRICSHCKTEYEPTKEEKRILGEDATVLYKGKGCPECLNTGYKGRVGIFEVLPISQEVKTLVLKTQDANEIRRFCLSEGLLTTMLEDGKEKVKAGITTLEELLRTVENDLFTVL